MLNLFIGQYKNEKTLIKFNMVRYTTMCIVLDYYCFMNSIESDVACTLDHLIGLVFNKSSFDDTEENRTMVQTTIINMKMMGQYKIGNKPQLLQKLCHCERKYWFFL